MEKNLMYKAANMVIPIVFVLVTFQWTPNSEPDMSHYELYELRNDEEILIQGNIMHPTSTIQVDLSVDNLRNGQYFLKAVDTEGYRSDRSDIATCDQACIDKYLNEGITDIQIKSYSQSQQSTFRPL